MFTVVQLQSLFSHYQIISSSWNLNPKANTSPWSVKWSHWSNFSPCPACKHQIIFQNLNSKHQVPKIKKRITRSGRITRVQNSSPWSVTLSRLFNFIPWPLNLKSFPSPRKDWGFYVEDWTLSLTGESSDIALSGTNGKGTDHLLEFGLRWMGNGLETINGDHVSDLDVCLKWFWK